MTFTVHQGRRYRAHLDLSWLESVASNATIANKLEDAGFSQVIVEGTGSTRWAFGTWPHSDTSADLPSQIDRVEEIG